MWGRDGLLIQRKITHLSTMVYYDAKMKELRKAKAKVIVAKRQTMVSSKSYVKIT